MVDGEKLQAATISGVWLRTFQSRIQVLVERDGKWHLVIDDLYDYPISHKALVELNDERGR